MMAQEKGFLTDYGLETRRTTWKGGIGNSRLGTPRADPAGGIRVILDVRKHVSIRSQRCIERLYRGSAFVPYRRRWR